MLCIESFSLYTYVPNVNFCNLAGWNAEHRTDVLEIMYLGIL
jgi:hypothetical protein